MPSASKRRQIARLTKPKIRQFFEDWRNAELFRPEFLAESKFSRARKLHELNRRAINLYRETMDFSGPRDSFVDYATRTIDAHGEDYFARQFSRHLNNAKETYAFARQILSQSGIRRFESSSVVRKASALEILHQLREVFKDYKRSISGLKTDGEISEKHFREFMATLNEIA